MRNWKITSHLLILQNHKPNNRVIDRNPVVCGVPPFSPARHARPPFKVLRILFLPTRGHGGRAVPSKRGESR